MNIWNGWTVTVPSGVGDAAATLPGSPVAGRMPLRASTGPGPDCRAARSASRASSVVMTPFGESDTAHELRSAMVFPLKSDDGVPPAPGERRLRVVGRGGEVDLDRAVRGDRAPAAGEQPVAPVAPVAQHRPRVGVDGQRLFVPDGEGVVVLLLFVGVSVGVLRSGVWVVVFFLWP